MKKKKKFYKLRLLYKQLLFKSNLRRILLIVKKYILLPFLIILAGCLNYQMEVSLYPDGSGNMTINYWVLLPDSPSVMIVDKLGLFEPDSIMKEFSSEFNTIKNINIITDTIEGTKRAIIDLSFNHIDSLNEAKAFRDYAFKFEDGAAGQKIFSQFVPPIATGFGMDPSLFNVIYIYTFPGDIIQHNAHSRDKRTLTWSYTLDQIGNGKTISVTFRPFKLKETPYWIYILSGAVLLIVIFFLFRRRKD
jgi:hypothetical protein